VPGSESTKRLVVVAGSALRESAEGGPGSSGCWLSSHASGPSPLLPTLAIQNLITGEDQAAAQLVEVFTFEGVERTDHIAGFYVIKKGRIAAAKIYREGSADVAVAARDAK
jgi:hypothetical protein